MDSYKYHRHPRRARLSHRSLDRQPNDHLGRSWSRPHLFEHRRQILRGCAECDTDAYTYSDRYIHTYSHANAHSDGNSNGHGKPDTDCDCDGNRDLYPNSHANGEPYPVHR